jgi:hypothetical protein
MLLEALKKAAMDKKVRDSVVNTHSPYRSKQHELDLTEDLDAADMLEGVFF